MSEDLPDFLGGEPAADPQGQPEPQPAPETPAEAPQQEPAAPVAEPAPEPAPAAPQAPEPQHAPLTALLDERERRQAAEARVRHFEEQQRRMEAQMRNQPPPNREEDPEGFEAYRENQVAAAMYTQKLGYSRRFAEMEHGKDAVKAAQDWYDAYAQQDPFFDRKVAASDDPYGLVMDEWKRQQFLTKADPTEYEAFLAWKAAQGGAPAPATAPSAPQPPARPAAPRSSIAAAPSAGLNSDVSARDGGEQFSAMFG